MATRATHCRGCAAPLPEAFLDLGETPLANSYVSPGQAGEPEPKFPLAVAYCPECHLAQLTHTVPPEEMFSHYLYFSSVSDSWLAHARKMADSLTQKFSLTAGSKVLEVASNDGYLLQYFIEKGIQVLGIEPAANIAGYASSKGIPTMNVFFGPDTVEPIRARFGSADVIIGCNVLAHVDAILPFLDSVRRCLKPNGVAVFEFPYLKDLLDHREFDTIYHEHIFYYSVSSIRNLAARAGLKLVDVERQPVHGGSLRVVLAADTDRLVEAAVEKMARGELEAGLCSPARYAEFSREVAQVKVELLAMLRELRAAGKRVAGYGAPAKGNTLLNYCGIGTDLIEFTVDRSPHKQNLLLPGSQIPIRRPEALAEEMPDCAVILPWNIAGEIVRQQREYTARGGRFIVPVPRPQYLDVAAAVAS